jgi:hypothetical protein
MVRSRAGVVPRVRRNMAMKALGLSWPSSSATAVTPQPRPSRSSAASSRARPRAIGPPPAARVAKAFPYPIALFVDEAAALERAWSLLRPAPLTL